jgi:hypothetical protein
MMPTLGSAVAQLGLGDELGQQVSSETDDERKKRLQQMQQQQLLGPAGSLAVSTLFAGSGGKAAGY